MNSLRNESNIPSFVRPFLWSYDVTKMDVERDKERIITNVLNYGTKQATDWVRETYGEEEIRKVLRHPRSGEWDRKSLNFWALVYDVTPQVMSRTERILANEK